MYRVVTDIKDHRGARILEKGPWLLSLDEARQWAGLLIAFGYKTFVEEMGRGVLTESNRTLG